MSWDQGWPKAAEDREITESSLGTTLKMAVIGQERPWTLVKFAKGTYGQGQ